MAIMNINATFIIKSEHEIHTYVIFSSGYWIYLFDAVTSLFYIKLRTMKMPFALGFFWAKEIASQPWTWSPPYPEVIWVFTVQISRPRPVLSLFSRIQLCESRAQNTLTSSFNPGALWSLTWFSNSWLKLIHLSVSYMKTNMLMSKNKLL